MKTTTSSMLLYAISGVLISVLSSCTVQSPTNEASKKNITEVGHETGDYELQAGDRVKLTGIFNTSKGYMGVVKGIQIPYFLNRDEEALKYRGKWVSVIGTLSKTSYPEGPRVQGRSGVLQLELESIEEVIGKDSTKEHVEQLSQRPE